MLNMSLNPEIIKMKTCWFTEGGHFNRLVNSEQEYIYIYIYIYVYIYIYMYGANDRSHVSILVYVGGSRYVEGKWGFQDLDFPRCTIIIKTLKIPQLDFPR